MAYNYNQSVNPMNMQQTVAPQSLNQNVQPIFPQPQGNVYNINSTLEVANVPVGAGISVALCLNEGVMYIKSMQNGNPLFWAYKIEPYDQSNTQKNDAAAAPQQDNITEILAQHDNRFLKIEEHINTIEKTLKAKKGDDFQI